jgi:hypothetical protein
MITLIDVGLNWSVRSLERFGTANLSRLVSSPNVKSVSEKCRLQTYCLESFLACCVCQVYPTIAEPCVKMEPENTKMKLLFL